MERGGEGVIQTQWLQGGLTSEQLNVVHAGEGDLPFLLLLRLFPLAAQHGQLVELQGDDVVVVCSRRDINTLWELSVSTWTCTCTWVRSLDTQIQQLSLSA